MLGLRMTHIPKLPGSTLIGGVPPGLGPSKLTRLRVIRCAVSDCSMGCPKGVNSRRRHGPAHAPPGQGVANSAAVVEVVNEVVVGSGISSSSSRARARLGTNTSVSNGSNQASPAARRCSLVLMVCSLGVCAPKPAHQAALGRPYARWRHHQSGAQVRTKTKVF
jgi:hypothetical protein